MDRPSPHRPAGTGALAQAANPRRWLLAFAVGLLLAGLSLSAPAIAGVATKAKKDGQPRRTALVIGNSDYRHVQKLLNPSRDATAIAAKLEQIGFEVTRVIDGDADGLRKALRDFSRSSAGSDIALFFYAGHGIQVSGENYFLPVSTDPSSGNAVLPHALSLDDVRRALRRASPGLTVFILDACRDNPFGTLARGKGSDRKAPVVLQPGLAQVQSAAGMLIAYATEPGRLAYDGKDDHSPFTASLLRYIDEPGLEIRLMLGRVREDVVAQTDGAQIPWVEEAVLGEFYFSERADDGGAQAQKGPSDDVTFWRSVWRSRTAGDYEAYLERFPKGTFAALATNRLKALKSSVRETALSAVHPGDVRDAAQWQQVQNSLYWLGYYNGKLTGVPDTAVVNAVQAFQTGAYEKPTGTLTTAEVAWLHDGAATSLVKLGERLSDRIVFDRVRLRSIERGIDEIAGPAYEQLAQKLADDPAGRDVLAEAKRQLDTMRTQRDIVKAQYARAANDYVTVVAAAGSGYATQLRQFRFGQMRVSDVTATRVDALAPRRQTFLKHALDYAEKGKINEKQWLDDLR